jgi:hypothetical protein
MSIGAFCNEAVLAETVCVKIVDPANSPLPAAKVSAINLTRSKAVFEDSKLSKSSEGIHCFSGAAGDLIKISASLDGFISLTLENVKLLSKVDRTLNITLNFQEGAYDEYK